MDKENQSANEHELTQMVYRAGKLGLKKTLWASW